MSTLSLRLPNSIHPHIKAIAQEEGVSISLFHPLYLKKYQPYQQKTI